MNNQMKEKTDEISVSDMPLHNFTIKLLFGPMFGCELNVTAGDYFLIINPSSTLQGETAGLSSVQEHAVHYTLNTLYIPCSVPSPNIILRLSHRLVNEEKTGYRVEVLDVLGNKSVLIDENEIFTHEHICFAFKQSEGIWPEDIINYNRQSTEPKNDHVLTNHDIANFFKKRKNRAIAFGLFLLFLLLISASVVWYKKVESDRHVLTLNSVLSGSPSPLEVVKSRDDKTIFVLAQKLQEMEWAQEALFIKIKDNQNVVPVWLAQHREDTVAMLYQAGYPVLQLDYSTPQHPILAIYLPLSKTEEENLRSVLLQKIPFATNIRFIVKNKEQLLKEAKLGLDRLHIAYRKVNTEVGYSLIIRDALSDSVLTSLSQYIKNFSNKWGSNIINFSINLDENWLQDKSYVDSSNGYLFLNPRHWYFPLKKRDINYD
ncbi:PrgH/EprH family type III secretion apparatus protein [Pectobacterium parvum]|uniref:PrgH/EprH family type III secretion apparatus protein n=1 Tax=Pectobacterium parvum TaxID=2778550 RepID=UPI000DD05BD2|nr:PrgH/EprH family type III secretion apparatus protein [Pectobacterium parvum]